MVTLVAVLAMAWLAHRLRWNEPILLVAGGCLIGLTPQFRTLALPSPVVLLLFLPPLLYWESLTTSLREIRTNLRGIVLLSTGLVLATAAAVAGVGHALGLAWPLAFALGAVVAPTDAIAVQAVARLLPRRIRTVLRAESLINDGTALALYAVVVGVAVHGQAVTWPGTAARFLLAYAGGVAIGAACAAVVVALRRRLHDRVLESALAVLTPFATYLPAQTMGVSGVVAVVTCGLIGSQAGPKVISAGARVQITGFWEVSTFILNSALFVMVGIQTPAIVSGISSISPGHAVVTALLVGGVVIAVRLLWLYSVPYLLRAIDRRPVQRTLRSGARERFPLAWSGVRGAVSLAAALSVPATTAAGRPLAGHGLLVFTAVAVILLTLVVQGTTMPAVIRWAGLRGDPDETTEERRAHRQIVTAALEALPDHADRLDTPPETTDAIRSELRQYAAEDPGPPDAGPGVRSGLELRHTLIGVKRSALIRLRDQRTIDDIVLRRLQSVLDSEEIRIELALRAFSDRPPPPPDGTAAPSGRAPGA
ncbi:Na+/H+ antiporter [Streptomyces echinatus]|uniref:CPA1 family monovalent cation:H+ antiporter n=2 Tax=Streptomyces echinatus TaxID=67293 RepID=A0A7W9PS14_9ACTN|nr:Na+/H+ antiporter [Streptomyces echinatus]MBB5926353.1 CPA1 family monovalent cation:H+ antiporter [Streptomyces echinatus]